MLLEDREEEEGDNDNNESDKETIKRAFNKYMVKLIDDVVDHQQARAIFLASF